MNDVKSAVTVTRDGKVMRDGEPIGHVEKRTPDDLHLRGEGGGLHVSFSRKPLWYPHAADGSPITDTGLDTRKAAVRRVADHSEPLSVSDVRLDRALGGDREFVHASVKWQGNYASVSRYPGERGWTIDYFVVAGSFFPAWSNGDGTRYTRPTFLSDDKHDAVNAAAVAAGLLAESDAETWESLMRQVQVIKDQQAASDTSA